MCDQDLHLKDQGHLEQNTIMLNTSTSLLSSPCAFSGLHLDGQPFRYYSPDASFSFFGYVFLFQCSPRLHLIKVSDSNLLETVSEQKGNHVRRCVVSCTNGSVLFQHVNSLAFLYSTSSFSISSSCPFLHFSCPFCVRVCGLAK